MTTDAASAKRVTDTELEAMRQLVTALQQRFPEVDDATVAACVNDVHRRFGAAPVRDFVPLLVEREAVRALTRIARDGIPAPRSHPR
ncbi:three-helix bundle dimerization domain-containing protein [Krasilnikovia sp. MM14-A1004]|uniref:three-helix bundle dimerization domain-containing protein n=1 Tax=Krasilnikovia sp. MM14-A1004 TaxID=3373541 RepID=UPI00399CF666